MRDRRLFVRYGQDIRTMALELLEAAAVDPDTGRGVLLKPNLVVARPAAAGATTHPQLVAGVIEFLLGRGVPGDRIRIAESSWTGGDTRRAFRDCGYEELSRRYGVALVDLKQDAAATVHVQGRALRVCRSVLQGDYFVNLPVLKGHCQTGMTCALKNLKGCIPDAEKHRYHREGLHLMIGLLSRAVPQDLIVVDGVCGDLSSELGGNPVVMDRLILGRDPVLVDSYVAQVMGFQPGRVPYILRAESLGVGSADVGSAQIITLGDPRGAPAGAQRDTSGSRDQAAREAVRSLTKYIADRQACSACYGNTLHALQRLQEEGRLAALPGPVRLGQGYRGRAPADLGVGACAAGGPPGRAARGRPRGARTGIGTGAAHGPCGCPPSGQEILEFLRGALR